jgi:hypothetical protein
MFYDCYNLKKLPTNFALNENTSQLSGFCFQCISLSGLPTNFWPNNGFIVEGEVNIYKAFYDCRNLSGNVPQYTLWLGEVYWDPLNAKATNDADLAPLTFKNCIRLENYNFIPKHWGRTTISRSL